MPKRERRMSEKAKIRRYGRGMRRVEGVGGAFLEGFAGGVRLGYSRGKWYFGLGILRCFVDVVEVSVTSPANLRLEFGRMGAG